MLRRTFIKRTGAAGLIGFIAPGNILPTAQNWSEFDLESLFQNPPGSAFPQVFWFWMNGNISREGITRDLEAMKEAGIGGVFNFDVGTGVPKGPVAYASAEWIGLKRFAMSEAERLGLEFTMHNCPGWSASGGPWITPELSMQEITWSEIYVRGNKQINTTLPKPLSRFNYYNDLVVLAFPSLEGEVLLQTMKVASNGDAVDVRKVTGEDGQGVLAAVDEQNQNAYLELQFEAPFEARTLTFFIAAVNSEARQPLLKEYSERTSVNLEASDDGAEFRIVTTINTGVEADLLAGDKFIVYDIPITKAKYFRLTSAKSRIYKQVRFSGITRLENWMEKTNSRATTIVYVEKSTGMFQHDQRDIPPASIIDADAVLILSHYVDANGVLAWDAPRGDWTIMRIGFTSNGRLIRSAPDGGIGLECDKYNAAAMDLHFSKMTEKLSSAMGPLAAKGRMGFEIDSYEAGTQNWTHSFEKIFQRRWGYDLLTYLPAIAGGHIVGSADLTERFLWDFRRLQADLIASNYYGRFNELCHQHGFRSYIEPYDQGPMEEMQIGSRVDVNLGEFWNGISTTFPYKAPVRRTLRLAASIAQNNNQKIVGAESFTAEPDASRWAEYPFALKSVGDKAFVKGINKMVIHRYAHQPNSSVLPGMTMGPWGIHFERTNTWWDQSKPWLQYLSRCQSLLQEGHAVADLLYFTGEDANIFTKVEPDELTPQPPEGYNYDLVNAETILSKIKIVDGMIVLNDLVRYQVLVLQNYPGITMQLLKKIHELVAQGMILIGEKPETLLGLNEHRNSHDEFEKITADLWDRIDGKAIREHAFGKGRVIWGETVGSVLQRLGVKPDFECSSHSGDAPVIYTHRKIGDAEIYFVSNQRRTYEEIACTFRIKNKQPELWDAVTGHIRAVGIYELTGDRVRMPVQFEPYGSVFVVFRSAPARQIHSVKKDNVTIVGTKDFVQPPRKLFKEVSDNFTVSFWAKPELSILLFPDIVPGTLGAPSTDYYAIYPASGKQLYGEGHAICGVTVGRNGVAAWEHCDIPLLRLAAETPISGWSHIVLLYKNRIPSVYVNGKFIGQGQRSNYIMHPSIGDEYSNEGASYYNGDMTEPALFTEVLSDEKIHELAARQPPLRSMPFIMEMAGNKKPAVLIFESGNYSLEYSNGEITNFEISDLDDPVEIAGPWAVRFPANLGAPAQLVLDKLISLHHSADPGVKYFSGTALYTNTFSFPNQRSAKNKSFWLDLGRVEVIADVTVNDIHLGVFWKRPYRVDITSVLKQGANKLELRVTNLWPNRLIGDEQLPDPDKFTPGAGSSGSASVTGGAIEELPQWYVEGRQKPANGRVTFATWKHFTKESPLLESGLIGPVVLYTAVLESL